MARTPALHAVYESDREGNAYKATYHCTNIGMYVQSRPNGGADPVHDCRRSLIPASPACEEVANYRSSRSTRSTLRQPRATKSQSPGSATRSGHASRNCPSLPPQYCSPSTLDRLTELTGHLARAPTGTTCRCLSPRLCHDRLGSSHGASRVGLCTFCSLWFWAGDSAVRRPPLYAMTSAPIVRRHQLIEC